MIEQSRILSEYNVSEYESFMSDKKQGLCNGEGYGCGEGLCNGDEDGAGYGCGESYGIGNEIGGERISSPDSSCGFGYG